MSSRLSFVAALVLIFFASGCGQAPPQPVSQSANSAGNSQPGNVEPTSISAGSPAATNGAAAGGRHSAQAKPEVRISMTHSGRYPIEVACTTGMVADLVREVGGDKVAIKQLMGAGVDPHLYKASRGDVAALDSADIIFYNGLHLEGKMADLFGRMANRKPTVAVAEYLDPHQILEAEEGAHDPHVWFDVSLWRKALDVVGESLAQYDPSHADEYRKRAAAYGVQLDALHEYAKQRLAEVPRERRVLVTAHDAFRYFGRAYDLEVRGIQGISTDSEAGVRGINELVRFIVERKIKAVFVETSVSDKNIQALIEGCGAQGHRVVIGGELFSDAMGAAGTPEGTYPGMVRHNVDQIADAQSSLAMAAVLDVHDVTVAYHRKPVLWDVDLVLDRPSLVGVVGPNGAASTLIKAILGLVPLASGSIQVFGQPVGRVRKRIGYVPQRESVDWDFPVSVLDVALMGTYGRLGWFRRPGSAQREWAHACLEKVGLADLADQQIGQLSGGQQQRTFLARALAERADIYFMDEPMAGVDAATEHAVFGLLEELRSQGKAVIVVHHDLRTVPKYFDHVVLLNMRLVASGPTATTFTRQNLQKTYGGRLDVLETAGLAYQAGTRTP